MFIKIIKFASFKKACFQVLFIPNDERWGIFERLYMWQNFYKQIHLLPQMIIELSLFFIYKVQEIMFDSNTLPAGGGAWHSNSGGGKHHAGRRAPLGSPGAPGGPKETTWPVDMFPLLPCPHRNYSHWFLAHGKLKYYITSHNEYLSFLYVLACFYF